MQEEWLSHAATFEWGIELWTKVPIQVSCNQRNVMDIYDLRQEKKNLWSKRFLENSPVKENPIPSLTKDFISKGLFFPKAEMKVVFL